MQSDIRIREAQPFFSSERARTPMKFGASVIEDLTLCHVRVQVETRSGRTAAGWGAIMLADAWSWPSNVIGHPDRDHVQRLLVDEFCHHLAAYPSFAHPIEIFADLQGDFRRLSARVGSILGLPEAIPWLAALVCASPIDAAIHDAFGHVNRVSSYAAYGPDFMSHDLRHYLGDDFAGTYPSQYLLDQTRSSIPAWHLVGGLDKLRQSEVDDIDPQDRLPASLEAWCWRDGISHAKVKLRGNDLSWDLDRLVEVHHICRDVAHARGRNVQLSADANEQCSEPEYVEELLSQLRDRDVATFQALQYVEQPTQRDLNVHRYDLHRLSRIKPIVADESIGGVEDLELAAELGWSGVALKTCKCHSLDLLLLAVAIERGLVYTLQDLTNAGIALIHSVSLAARLNVLVGVEANSLQFFPTASKPEAAVHPGIYRRQGGVLTTGSLGDRGIGYRIEEIDRDTFRSPATKSVNP